VVFPKTPLLFQKKVVFKRKRDKTNGDVLRNIVFS